MPVKKVLITAGGTGGHLFPAQGLAQELQKLNREVLFVAGGLKTSRFFDREQFNYEQIACSPLISRNPLKVIKGLFSLFKGSCETLAIMKKFKPDVVVGFGSFYTVSTLIAARLLKIPIILHEANSVPGKANQWLSSFADTIAIHFPSTSSFFKGKTVEVGLPLREGYKKGVVSKEKALAFYDLDPERPTLLIVGGSQGAKGINAMIQTCMTQLQNLSLQVIHLTGDAKEAETLKALYRKNKIPASVKPFETQMQMAWIAADAFIGRSGASTVAESVEFEVPGILIPYPHATDNHQEKNADFLVDVVKSSQKLLEKDAEKLAPLLEKFFQKEQLESSLNNMKTYKKRPYQMTLCDLILGVL